MSGNGRGVGPVTGRGLQRSRPGGAEHESCATRPRLGDLDRWLVLGVPGMVAAGLVFLVGGAPRTAELGNPPPLHPPPPCEAFDRGDGGESVPPSIWAPFVTPPETIGAEILRHGQHEPVFPSPPGPGPAGPRGGPVA